MKIALNVTVEVDPQRWADEYGITTGEVREDVLAYFRTHVGDAPALAHTGATATVKAPTPRLSRIHQ